MIKLPNDYASIEAATDGGKYGQLEAGKPYVLKMCAIENKTSERIPRLSLYGDMYDPADNSKPVKSYTDDTPENAWRHRYDFLSGVFGSEGEVDFKKLKGFMAKVEASNPGFTFDGDEQKLAGKYVGVVLRDRSYVSKRDGQVKHVLDAAQWLTVADAKAGEFNAKLAEPKVGDGVAEAEARAAQAVAQPATAALADEDIPF